MNDGGPAFPRITLHETKGIPSWTLQDGMSLRDWFAGQTISGQIAAHTENRLFPDAGAVAAYAYEIADAMLQARDTTNERSTT